MIVIMQMLRGTLWATIFVLMFIGTLRLTSTAQAAPPKKKPSATEKVGVKVPATNPKDLFVDVTRAAGIDFHLTCGSKESCTSSKPMWGAAADYDNDGWMDILLVDGSTVEDYRAGKCHIRRLYHNQHDGTFIDVSAKSGLNFCVGLRRSDRGLHNDGWVRSPASTVLALSQQHNGTFTGTAKAGSLIPTAGARAAFGDYDNDGNSICWQIRVELDINSPPGFGDGPFCQYRGR
jgi:hypothetical protein